MTTAMILGLLAHWSVYYTIALNVGAGILALMLVATFVVRLTASKVDDVFVHDWNMRILKAFSILPYWGVNPLQKKLYDTLKEMDQKSQEEDAQEGDLKL